MISSKTRVTPADSASEARQPRRFEKKKNTATPLPHTAQVMSSNFSRTA